MRLAIMVGFWLWQKIKKQLKVLYIVGMKDYLGQPNKYQLCQLKWRILLLNLQILRLISLYTDNMAIQPM